MALTHDDFTSRFDRDCEREPSYATSHRPTLLLSEIGAVRLATEFPASFEYYGRTWVQTGRTSRDMRGEQLAEYNSKGREGVDLRVWANAAGTVLV